MTDSLDQLRGALADRYRLERELGRGGMAAVYLARDLKHHRPIALKVLHPELAHALGADRFLREIEVVAGLTHPHILPLHDSGGSAGLLWYTMPYVDGESLRDRLRREGRLPLEEALRITTQVADALYYAHGRGIIHRDLKPENILLSAAHAFVADFGIARALMQTADDRLTGTGLTLGTPAYMSPEQAAGEQQLDGRSDIFSLACVLYEMLAGEPPFRGPTPQAVLAQRFTASAPPLRSRRAGLPEAVEAAVARALARDPADRFATAAEFAAALAAARDGPSSASAPTVPVPSAGRAGAVTSIAVLPFADMSAERDQEYLADGIAEEIINALSRIGALRVAARTSSFAFKGRNEDIGEIGRRLKVATILEGSVRKAGNRLRVTAQLVSVAEGYHLWSERYDRELADVFAVQDEIAANVVRALPVVMSDPGRRAVERPRPESVQAYEYYLRGRQLFHQFRKKQLHLARRMFERAIELDPGFVLAHAGTADCSSMLYMYWEASEANLRQADAASRKALELGPGVAEAHAARGLALTLRREYQAAQRELESAIALDPRLYEAWYFYARVCFQKGAFAEAVRLFEHAAGVRPDDFQALSYLSMTYDAMGLKEESRSASGRALRNLEQHLELNPEDARGWYLGAIDLAKLGEREKAVEWGNRALSLDPNDGGVLYGIACMEALQGEHERALDLLERAFETGFGRRDWIENDPDLASLRESPRFRMLLDRLPARGTAWGGS